MGTSDLSGLTTDDALSDEALVERSRQRAEKFVLEDAELRKTLRSPNAMRELETMPTTIELVAKAFELYADRRCLGERVTTEGGDLTRDYRYFTFAEIWERVAAFSSGLAHEGLVPPGTLVGICGFGSIDWVVADLACLYLSAVSVPLQSSMSAAELQLIVGDAELGCIVCSAEQIDVIFGILPQCPSVKSVIVMDREARDYEERAADRVIVRRMSEVEAHGREAGLVPKVLPSARKEPDPLMSLVYTSGSTGTPKGAMFPEALLRRMWARGAWGPMLDLGEVIPQVTVGYMPLSHAAGRWGVMSSISQGGELAFVSRSDMSTLFEDIQLVRPTSMLLVPRVAEMIHHRYLAEVARRASGIGEGAERERIAAEVTAEMGRALLGDRMLIAMLGSAPTPPAVVAFLKRCFRIPVFDGYGSTEAGMITADFRAASGMTWRLVDVPELGYRSTDKPYPRGELHVKTSLLVPGYYKNEKATKDLYDDQGFMNTGDIVEQRGADCLVWIDRVKNILKLSQGEFVATSRLEGVYASRSRFVRQVYLYGNSARSYLLAVVVPDLDAVNAYLKGSGIEPDAGEVKKLLRSELNRVAREEELHGYEVPRDFIVESEPFTIEAGLLTASNKPARAKLRAYYGTRLDALYATLERSQIEELASLRAKGSAVTTSDKVQKVIAAMVGLPEGDVDLDQTFIQLGGDSLAAVGLEDLLNEVCDVHVPVGLLLDPTSTIRTLVQFIERAERGESQRTVSFDQVHGRGAKVIRASDVRIEKFLGDSEIAAARVRLRGELPVHGQTALLTGANGFLGRFLTLDLLEQLAAEKTRVYAIVRAPNDKSAFERLAQSYQTDPDLAARFARASAGGRLVVLAGDLMKPRFGLDDTAYERIADDVDRIVHNGAAVNHALGYEQLFEPNVLGTVEVLRLALTGRSKSIAYVSTLGIFGASDGRSGREDDDLRVVLPERRTEEGYAAGYGTSKWVSELLLRDAHDKLGLSITVFRPSEIMAHSRYAGQVNVPDFFTRLVVGIVYTGIAPRSFYTDELPDRARHYDGLPVDVVARSMAAPIVRRRLADEPTYETFHVDNPHYEDGISLDVIVAWIRSGGYRVERIADYDAWYRTFYERLSGLSEPRRHHSPLVIVSAWARPQAKGQLSADNPHLLARLAAITPSLAELPHIDERLIHKYLGDLTKLRIIDPPPTDEARKAAG
jgi:fatty acid CoA ligase FadD9